MLRSSFVSAVLLAAGLALSGCAHDQGGPGWVTLLDGSSMKGWYPVGNANWRYTERGVGRGSSNNDGLGKVNYKYRISRHEVTTGQWMEFVNAIAPLTDDPAQFARPKKAKAQSREVKRIQSSTLRLGVFAGDIPSPIISDQSRLRARRSSPRPCLRAGRRDT